MKLMNKILIIDPGKGWGQFVSKMYCYQKLANHLNSKITFLTKKSTQAEHYLKSLSFCEDVLYIEESKKGAQHTLLNIKSIIKNIKIINRIHFDSCYVFHPSLRYGGYHLFFFIFFIPLSIFLEKFSKDIPNFNRKIIVVVLITVLIFLGRNINRLIKENKIYSYQPFKNVNYPLNDDSFRYQLEMQNIIKKNKAKEIYKNRYIFLN